MKTKNANRARSVDDTGSIQADADIVARARRGDVEAHAALYEQHAAAVLTLARRMLGSSSRAEDVLQDTFVEVIRGVGSFRNEAQIGTWIQRIAINKCLSLLRSHWWLHRLPLDEPDGLVGKQGLDTADLQVELERLLDRLPDVARAVVWLHDGEGLTHREIGELMGKSESFSKSQLQRAHRRLRRELAGGVHEEVDRLCIRTI